MLDRRTFVAGLGASFIPLPAIAGSRSPNGYLITRWRQDPFALGSYSYLAKSSSPKDRRALARPIDDKVFFAGEATSTAYPSTVHGALQSGRDVAKQVLATKPKTVAIIGAGFSGLGAAHWLTTELQGGSLVQVQVFEARNRLGGRVHTNTELGVPLDLGASWIHGVTDNPLTEIADELGVQRSKTDYSDEVELGPPNAGSPSWMDDTWIRQEYGAEPTALSNKAETEGAWSYGGDVLFKDGYASLLPGLEGPYRVELSQIVKQISWTNNKVSIKTQNKEAEFDAVIVTVPLGVLKAGHIAFSPGLPRRKQQAIDRLGMGLLDKLYLRFDNIFWDKDVEWLTYVTPKRNGFPSWLNIAKHTGEPILMAFAGGDPAEERASQSDKDILNAAQKALEQMYPK